MRGKVAEYMVRNHLTPLGKGSKFLRFNFYDLSVAHHY